jgi:hypothetical protein
VSEQRISDNRTGDEADGHVLRLDDELEPVWSNTLKLTGTDETTEALVSLTPSQDMIDNWTALPLEVRNPAGNYLGGINVLGQHEGGLWAGQAADQIHVGGLAPAPDLRTGLKCYDSNDNLVFEVRTDGSVHIKSGTSIVADL